MAANFAAFASASTACCSSRLPEFTTALKMPIPNRATTIQVTAEVGFGFLRPQFGQDSAWELICFPHSFHLTSAIYYSPVNLCVRPSIIGRLARILEGSGSQFRE